MDRASELPLIELHDVRVMLGRRVVLENITWELRPGQHWLISGPNGSGKTTLLRVIRGDQPIAYGIGSRAYRLRGNEPDALASAKAKIGYLSPELHERLLRMELTLDVRELILGGVRGTLYLSEAPTVEEKARVQLLAERLGIARLLDDPMNELSFGQLRRALIARALAGVPRVVVLDEFAHGIDRKSRDVIAQTLAEAVREGTALVVATHRREELPAAITHELRLENGRVVFTGLLDAPVFAKAARNGKAVGSITGGVIVKLENVDVFQEARQALRGINWEIRAGEHWFVSGPNGAGKSTLAKLLYGRLRSAHGGRIERDGSYENVSVANIRRSVGLISDEEQLRYDWSIAVEDVILSGFFASVGLMSHPSAEQYETSRRLMNDFGVEHLAKRPFLELSFGQRRLVLVIRALVRIPRLLILDEALNGFDGDVRARILRRVEELARSGTAVVMIGHHEGDIPDWIENELRLEEGRVAAIVRR
ncbi:MAG TPA: ATP-binding cassette domain-containing protein [Candidatus Acidoferrales bacterium]|nr:ATP-binding cassette domain-containing protein [Candidatus Acidoferrales bacterium]